MRADPNLLLGPPRWASPYRLLSLLAAFAVLLLGLIPATAPAQEDPPGRVGRVADVQGKVSWFDHEQGQWLAASRNLPVTGGDRISTGPQARAELRVGSTSLSLDARTELEVLRLDDQAMAFKLHSGSLALRVRAREVAAEVEIVTAEARLRPQRAGHYRVDRVDDTTFVGSWRGDLRVEDEFGFTVATGQRAELWRDGASRALRHAESKLPADAFAERVALEEQRDERTVTSRYVSPEMTGAEDLDRHGRWDTHPEFGAVWYPIEVRAGWAPYRNGRWAWVRPWGWTWVDEAPWGFAPFHYGRWVQWRDRWGWVPGVYVPRPMFAPALVSWPGGPRVGVTVTVGSPPTHWTPLAPREVFVPWYRHTPVYRGRVNEPSPPSRGNGVFEGRWEWRSDGRREPPPEPRTVVRPGWRAEGPGDAAPPARRPDRPDRPDRHDHTDRKNRPDRPDPRGPGSWQTPVAPIQPANPALPNPLNPAPRPPAPGPAAPAPGVVAPPAPSAQAPVARPPAPAVRPAPPQGEPVGAGPAPQRPAEAARDDERRRIPNPQRNARGENNEREHQR